MISEMAAAEDDYPCVRRLRHRRLVAYLHNQGFQAAFHSVIQELGRRQHTAIFSVAHLRKLVAGGRWSDALSYVHGFFLPLPPRDAETQALIMFLNVLRTLASIAAAATGSRNVVVDVIAAEKQRRYVALFVSICRCHAKLSSIVDTMLNSPLYRASLGWELLKQEASSIAHDLALQSPELSRLEVRSTTAGAT